MIGALLGELWPIIAAVGGAIAALLATYAKGRKDAAGAAKKRELEDYKDTRERMDDEDYIDDDLGVILDRMRKRGNKR